MEIIPPASDAPRRRGRPRGATPQGIDAKRRLYTEAIALIAERGYEQATLREIGERAGASPALLYRYFPNKRAVVLALYEELSAEYATRARAMKAGPWRERFVFALRSSLEVLAPHRKTIAALVPHLVGGTEDAFFAPSTGDSRTRVRETFELAVTGANDALPADDARALGRLLYLLHFAVLLGWSVDKSPDQRATRGLLAVLEKALPMLALAVKLPGTRALVREADARLRDGVASGGSAPETPAGG